MSGQSTALSREKRLFHALRRGGMLATTALAGFAVIGSAHAQDVAAPSADSATAADRVQEIVVTGSRIARRDYTADSPVLTVSDQALTTTSGVAIESKLNQLPQFTPAQTAFASGPGQSGQATLNLRGLGDYRNLILLDGKRLQPSSGRVTVDINTLPQSIIDNVEVITGGASAVYGSDAISGVVNFKLKHNFQGLEVNASSSISDQGDAWERQAGVLLGGNFADDRGNAMIAFDYTKRGASFQRDRSFYQDSFLKGTGTSALPYLPAGAFTGDPTNPVSQAAVDSVFGGYGYAPGTVPASGVDFGFNNDGSLFSSALGALNYKGPLYPTHAITPGGGLVYNAAYPQYLSTPMERYSAFGRLEYELSDNVTAYAQAMYTDYTTKTNGASAPASGLWVINVPYGDGQHPVPDDLATLLASRPNPNADFQIGKRLNSVGLIEQEHRNDVYQVLAGLKGSFADDQFSWEVYGSHGRSRIIDATTGGAVSYTALLDLVSRPNYGAGATDPSNGLSCTSGIQLFGDVPMSQDCVNWLTKPVKNYTETTEDVVEATLQGKIATLPAGDLRFAVGADYRRDSYSFESDSLLNTAQSNNVVGVFGAESTSGSSKVWELYSELLVPVIADKPFFKSLDLDLAYRYSNYAISGGVHTYKASADWAIVDAFRIRGGYQRAIRAPNVAELYQGATVTVNLWPDSDPCSTTSQAAYGNNAGNPNRAQVQALCSALGVPNAGTFTYFTPLAIGQSIGNRDLKPEKADTYTIGFVIRPEFEAPLFRRLSASVDAYRINLSGAIGLLPPADTYAQCFNADGSNPTYSADNAACQLIHRDDGSTTATGIASGIPTWTDQPYANLGGFKTQGVDVQVDWSIPLGIAAGSIDLNFVGTYLDQFKVQTAPGQPYLDYSGTIGNTVTGIGFYPKWRHVLSASYALSKFTIGGRWHYYDSVDYYTNVSIPGDTTAGTKAYSSFDLFGSVAINDAIELRGGVDNVTDKRPLVVGGIPGSTEPTVYDPIGRRFFLAARARF